eukprot:scaffold948_cov68-Phaeocystis_antarctica.AAC.7
MHGALSLSLARPLSLSHLLLAPAFHRSSRPLCSALQPPPFPRAAVAVTLMRETAPGPREYLLVQRSKPPNVGSWSLPGGKIELGETTLAAGARELEEETALGASDGVRLHPDSIGSSDAIVPDGSGGLQFHYVITQLFAFCTDATVTARSGDDAAAVRWVTLAEAEDGTIHLGGNVCAVLRRAEQLLACGVLQLSADATSMNYPTREP